MSLNNAIAIIKLAVRHVFNADYYDGNFEIATACGG